MPAINTKRIHHVHACQDQRLAIAVDPYHSKFSTVQIRVVFKKASIAVEIHNPELLRGRISMQSRLP
jgi:hypothetical protein